jgi:hypothetical protein
MPNVIMLNVIILSVIMLSVIMLSVIMLNVIILSVVAPILQPEGKKMKQRISNPPNDGSCSKLIKTFFR